MTSRNLSDNKGDCQETISHGSLTFLHILWADALAAFVFEYLFKGACIANNPEI